MLACLLLYHYRELEAETEMATIDFVRSKHYSLGDCHYSWLLWYLIMPLLAKYLDLSLDHLSLINYACVCIRQMFI